MLEFLAPFATYLDDWAPRLARAALVSARISLFGFAVAAVLGLALAVARSSGSRPARAAVRLYVAVFRGIPVLAVLFLIYFGLPGVGIVLPAEPAAIAGLGLCFAAQMAEVFRAGLGALPKGQWEAAMAVGLTPAQAMRAVILPQVARVVAAPVIVTFVALLKDSSLASLITVNELVLEGRALATEYFLPLHIFVLVGVAYFAIAFPLSMLAKHLARRARAGGR